MNKLLAYGVLVSFMALPQVQAASFSCKAAKLKAEQQICQNIGLNDADVKLATTYQIILLHCQWAGGMQKRTSSSSG